MLIWLPPISGIMIIPVDSTRTTQSTSKAIASASGTSFTFRQNRSTLSYTFNTLSNSLCDFSFVFFKSTTLMLGTTVSATIRLAIRL